KQRLDAPEAATIGRATRTSRSRERVRTSHPHYGARSSFPARQKKISFREGTPELASPCRLFGRRDQSAFAPYGAMLKQSCPRFNADRRKGCSILNHCRSLRAWRLRPHPSSRREPKTKKERCNHVEVDFVSECNCARCCWECFCGGKAVDGRGASGWHKEIGVRALRLCRKATDHPIAVRPESRLF